MILACDTEEERKSLIFRDETIQKYNYDPLSLGRHSKCKVIFRCVVCSLPHENTIKLLLDKKGITHPGECRFTFKQMLGKQARQNEDPSNKLLRIQKLREKLEKDKDQVVAKRQNTLIEKYGSKNLSEIDSIRNSISNGLKKAFNQKGTEIIKKRQATNVEKYNSTNFLASDKGRELVKKHNQEKYNTDFPFQNKEFQANARSIYIEKTGFQNPSRDPKLLKKREQTNIGIGFIKVLSSGERVSDYCDRKNIKHSNAFQVLRELGEDAFYKYVEAGPSTSSLEVLFIELLHNEFPNLTHFNQKPTEKLSVNYKPDFRLSLGDKVIYVNVDGLYWHSSAEKENNYHLKIRRAFKDVNLSLIQLREDEIKNKPEIVKSIMLAKFGLIKKLNARSCTIKPLVYTEAKEFLKQNHLMGPSTATYYGLYKEEELVTTIGVKTTKNGELEIVRFGSKNFTQVRGGFSKLLNHVIKKYNPTSVVSFCDLRYADGHSYEKLGFKLVSISQGWQWTDFRNTYNRLKCRANMDSRRLSEKQHAEELGWHKIYDAGQAKYVLDLEII